MYSKTGAITRTPGKPPEPGVILHINSLAITLAFVITLAGILGAVVMDAYNIPAGWIVLEVTLLSLIAFYVLFALKIARQWEKAAILRLGRFLHLAGPGPFWIVPVVDSLANWIDHRVMVTPFSAEKTLTKAATQLQRPPAIDRTSHRSSDRSHPPGTHTPAGSCRKQSSSVSTLACSA